MADTKELVAYKRTEAEIAEHIGADAVIYQTLSDLVKSCSTLSPHIKNFEVGVFNGEYVTPVEADYFKRLEDIRGESSRKKRQEAVRTAVAAGMASASEVADAIKSAATNGDDSEKVNNRMDVSIHNFGDYVDLGQALEM